MGMKPRGPRPRYRATGSGTLAITSQGNQRSRKCEGSNYRLSPSRGGGVGSWGCGGVRKAAKSQGEGFQGGPRARIGTGCDSHMASIFKLFHNKLNKL